MVEEKLTLHCLFSFIPLDFLKITYLYYKIYYQKR